MRARPPRSRASRRSNPPKASIATFGASTGSSFPGRRPSNRKSRRNTKPHKQPGCRCDYAKGVPLQGLREARAACAIPNQATFHPTKYLQGLVRCINGARRQAVRRHRRDERGGRGRRCCREDRGRANHPREACRRRHQLADQRSRRAAFQTGAVPHLCDGAAAAARHAARRALLGHARSLSLCAPAPRQGCRLPHRRRRRPQERRSRRRGISLRGARSVDPQSGAASSAA